MGGGLARLTALMCALVRANIIHPSAAHRLTPSPRPVPPRHASSLSARPHLPPRPAYPRTALIYRRSSDTRTRASLPVRLAPLRSARLLQAAGRRPQAVALGPGPRYCWRVGDDWMRAGRGIRHKMHMICHGRAHFAGSSSRSTGALVISSSSSSSSSSKRHGHVLHDGCARQQQQQQQQRACRPASRACSLHGH